MIKVSTFKTFISFTLTEKFVLSNNRKSNKMESIKLSNLHHFDDLFELIDKNGDKSFKTKLKIITFFLF